MKIQSQFTNTCNNELKTFFLENELFKRHVTVPLAVTNAENEQNEACTKLFKFRISFIHFSRLYTSNHFIATRSFKTLNHVEISLISFGVLYLYGRDRCGT